jgi:hypothetical protein
MILGGLGVVLAIATAARTRQPADARPRVLSDTVVLRQVARELDDVRRTREGGGWTADLIARALVASRVAAVYLTGGHPTQRVVARRNAGSAGLLLHERSRRRIGISAAVTPQTLLRAARAEADGDPEGNPEAAADVRPELLADMQRVLEALTRAQYGREQPVGVEALDDALDGAQRVVRSLTRDYAWLARTLASTSARVSGATRALWSR